jgi:hypothetical protein
LYPPQDGPEIDRRLFGELRAAARNALGMPSASCWCSQTLRATELVVGALDSGSDKEFDLLGIAKAVKILSETLLECWNRYRSARAIDTSVSYKTAFEGITLLEKLQVAQQNNSVSAETAESLRRTIVKSIGDLFSNGVYTDAMEGQAIVVPSALPVERRKLLTHTASGGNRDSEEDPVPADDEDTAALDEQPV